MNAAVSLVSVGSSAGTFSHLPFTLCRRSSLLIVSSLSLSLFLLLGQPMEEKLIVVSAVKFVYTNHTSPGVRLSFE